jgi:hypothetical protein
MSGGIKENHSNPSTKKRGRTKTTRKISLRRSDQERRRLKLLEKPRK